MARPELVGDIERALQLDLGSLSDVVHRAALTHTRLGAAITLP